MRMVSSAALAGIVAATVPLAGSCESSQRNVLTPVSAASAPTSGVRWTSVERRAWADISRGRPISLPGKCPDLEETDTRSDDEVDASGYTLSGSFIAQVLADGRLAASPDVRSIQINGARIVGDVVLKGGTSRLPLEFKCSTVEGTVQFQDWEFLGGVDFSQVKFAGPVLLYDVDARYLVAFTKSDLDRAHVLRSRFGRDLSFRASRVRSELKLVSTRVGGSVLLGCFQPRYRCCCGSYASTIFLNLDVAGSLDSIGSDFVGPFSLEAVDVDASMDFRRGRVPHLAIRDSDVNGNLDFRQSTLRYLDLSGTVVRRELRLARSQKAVDWGGPGDGARFIARNTRVGSLRDTEDSWPPWLELDGFEYERLGGVEGRFREGCVSAWCGLVQAVACT